jgi:hypothetical protein
LIAFAFVFLSKVAIKNPVNVRINNAGITDALNTLITVFDNITAIMHPRQLLSKNCNRYAKAAYRLDLLWGPVVPNLEEAPQPRCLALTTQVWGETK